EAEERHRERRVADVVRYVWREGMENDAHGNVVVEGERAGPQRADERRPAHASRALVLALPAAPPQHARLPPLTAPHHPPLQPRDATPGHVRCGTRPLRVSPAPARRSGARRGFPAAGHRRATRVAPYAPVRPTKRGTRAIAGGARVTPPYGTGRHPGGGGAKE